MCPPTHTHFPDVGRAEMCHPQTSDGGFGQMTFGKPRYQDPVGIVRALVVWGLGKEHFFPGR